MFFGDKVKKEELNTASFPPITDFQLANDNRETLANERRVATSEGHPYTLELELSQGHAGGRWRGDGKLMTEAGVVRSQVSTTPHENIEDTYEELKMLTEKKTGQLYNKNGIDFTTNEEPNDEQD